MESGAKSLADDLGMDLGVVPTVEQPLRCDLLKVILSIRGIFPLFLDGRIPGTTPPIYASRIRCGSLHGVSFLTNNYIYYPCWVRRRKCSPTAPAQERVLKSPIDTRVIRAKRSAHGQPVRWLRRRNGPPRGSENFTNFHFLHPQKRMG